jgi:hypothetical protein
MNDMWMLSPRIQHLDIPTNAELGSKEWNFQLVGLLLFPTEIYVSKQARCTELKAQAYDETTRIDPGSESAVFGINV